MATRDQKASQRQERRAAESLGGFTQKGSGSNWAAKGDVRVPGEVRLECKTTIQKFYSLKHSDLAKIRREALRGMDNDWAFQVEFRGPVGMNRKFAIVDSNVLATMEIDMSSFHHERARGKTFAFTADWMARFPKVLLGWPEELGAPPTIAIMHWDVYVNTSRREI